MQVVVLRALLVVALAILSYAAHSSLLRAGACLAIGGLALLLPRWLSRKSPRQPRPPASRTRYLALRVLVFLQAVALAVAETSDFPLIIVVGEVLAGAVALSGAGPARRRYQQERSRGTSRGESFFAGLGEVAPESLVRFARADAAILAAAARLVTPRPASERRAERWRHGSAERLIFYVLAPVATVEVAVIHHLLRGTPFQLPLLVLGLLSFPYLLGLIAQTRAFPHLLFEDRLLLRGGDGFALTIPRQAIGSVSRRTILASRERRHLRSDGTLVLPSGGRTSLHLQLCEPVPCALGEVRAVSLHVDGKATPPGLQALLQ